MCLTFPISNPKFLSVVKIDSQTFTSTIWQKSIEVNTANFHQISGPIFLFVVEKARFRDNMGSILRFQNEREYVNHSKLQIKIIYIKVRYIKGIHI